MELENEIKRLTFLTDQAKMNHFGSTDEEFCFFNRFSSEEIFMLFWESVALPDFRIIYWTKTQREAYGTPSPHRKLPLIDNCFLFLAVLLLDPRNKLWCCCNQEMEVMAVEGFEIERMLAEVGATLIIAPFKKSAQFSKEDAEKTQAIAHLRVPVERAIRREKEYHAWDGVVPLSLTGSVN
ncbi:hypothetical protein AOLI_G00174530 [Acnodon oligacanthus]